MINAHTLNEPFQQSIKHIFGIGKEAAKDYDAKSGKKIKSEIDPNVDIETKKTRSEKFKVLYHRAPVKLTERCQVKVASLACFFCLFVCLFCLVS